MSISEHPTILQIHFILFEQPAWLAWKKAARDLGLPLIEIDEDARKAAQEKAREERRAKLQQLREEREREREQAARGEETPEEPPPRRGLWGMGGRGGGDEGVGRSKGEGRNKGERGFKSFLGGDAGRGVGGLMDHAGRGVGGLMDLLGNTGAKKGGGAFDAWQTGKAGGGWGDVDVKEGRREMDKDVDMQDSDSARSAAWDMGHSGWGVGGFQYGAPQTEAGDEKEKRAPSWLDGAEKESEEEGSDSEGETTGEETEEASDEKQKLDGVSMKKVTSSSGSFRTGQEDFDGEESQEEEGEGKVSKRVRSEGEYKDAENEEAWDVQDRRNKETEDAPTILSTEVAGENKSDEGKAGDKKSEA